MKSHLLAGMLGLLLVLWSCDKLKSPVPLTIPQPQIESAPLSQSAPQPKAEEEAPSAPPR